MSEVTALVLTRKLGQTIDIDNTTSVTIVEVKGNKVRLKIEAPREVPVHRREVTERIQGGVA